MIPLEQVDADWTLFLDRDGVINHEKENDYINTWDEFLFYDGALEAFQIFAGIFKRIIIVTNQKGVGKGVTKEADLQIIHKNMQAKIEQNGGRIDAIYYCTDLDNDSANRKPQIGMGLQAIEKFSEIDITKAIMIGNNLSDMQFGRNLGVYNVLLTTTIADKNIKDDSIDATFSDLSAFSLALV